MLRHIPLGDILNLRDLGGYRGAEGKTTVWERFLRADTPKGLSEVDIQWLLERGITTLIDLRSGGEVQRFPNQLAEHPAFHYHHCSLLGGEVTPLLEEDVGAGYFRVLDGKTSVLDVMRLILAAPEGVLFHCMAGKDRTGMIAMLLLSLAGVGREDILADYQVSEIYLEEMVRKLSAARPEMPAFAGRSRAEYMETCLQLLLQEYGSVPEYLLAAGLTQAELGTLRGRLLE